MKALSRSKQKLKMPIKGFFSEDTGQAGKSCTIFVHAIEQDREYLHTLAAMCIEELETMRGN